MGFGFIIPYDYIDMDYLEAHRYGAIGFVKFHAGPVDITTNLNAFQMSWDAANDHMDYFEDTFYYGAGVTTAYAPDFGVIVPGFAASYQYTQDDTDAKYDYQHLVKGALSLGIRMGDNAVCTLYGIYNKDITDYDWDIDDDSIDAALEFRFNIGETFSLSFGYKKTLDLDNYESDLGYMGALFQF